MLYFEIYSPKIPKTKIRLLGETVMITLQSSQIYKNIN